MTDVVNNGFLRDQATGALTVLGPNGAAIGGSGTPAAGSVTRQSLSTLARDPWLPAGALAQNYARFNASNTNVGALSSGRLSLVGGIALAAGVPVNSITFFSGSAAAATPTNQWFALYDASTRALLAVTADDGAAAWAASSAKTLALAAPYTPASDQQVWLGIVVVATTVPNLTGATAMGAAVSGVTPLLVGTSNTGLTNPASAPNPCAAPGSPGAVPYCFVS